MSDLCPVAVSQDSSEDEFHPETAGESHLLLLKQKKYCDVTFTFPNLPDRIEAHQVFLKARSPEFAKIFRMRKSGNVPGNELKITESSPDIFQRFLEFIYADKLEVDIAEALDLLQLSLKYKVQSLTKKCEELLKSDIPIVDSVKVFEAARRRGRVELMDRAGQIMVRTFLMLMKLDAITTAEEETLAYLLNSDDLSVKEVELFEVILNWGRNQVGNCADDGLLKKKLKNLIPKIRYTNMAPGEFTKVVAPTGFLSAEETIAVLSYFCVDDVTRRDLKIEFNTTLRKVVNIKSVTKCVIFNHQLLGQHVRLPAFSKHSMSFHVDRRQVDGKVKPDYNLRKTAITGIGFGWPYVNSKYSEHHVANYIISVVEYSGPAKERNLTIRFQKKLLNCTEGHWDKVSVEPPVELICGRTYSVIVEDQSTADSIESFRKDPNANEIWWTYRTNREANVNFEDVCLNLRDIDRKTDFYPHKFSDESKRFALIQHIAIGLL